MSQPSPNPTEAGGARRLVGVLLRRWRRALAIAALFAAVPLTCDLVVGASTEVHADATRIEHRPVALVLGTAPTVFGRPNLFYRYRLEAAAALWEAGAVDGFLVSGDNGDVDYDEPTAMRADLAELGVPLDAITCDFAGFRTLDSVVRAKEVFGLDRVTIVSQPSHAERAVFLAERHGLDAIAFGARTPGARRTRAKARGREVLARTLAVWDVIVGTEPRFLGPQESVATVSRPR